MVRDVSAISAYLPVYEVADGPIPLREVVASLLTFCREVVIADGGSRDGTWDQLVELARDPRVRPRRFRALDPDEGESWRWQQVLKAYARAGCRGEYCFEAAPQRLVRPEDGERIKDAVAHLDDRFPVLALPVIEYWDGTELARRDLPSSVPCLSRNDTHIGHRTSVDPRIPAQRQHAYMHLVTEEPLPHRSLLEPRIEAERLGPAGADRYGELLQEALASLPVLQAMGWVDLRKGLETHARRNRSARALPLADKPWAEVTTEEMDGMVDELRRFGPSILTGFNAATPLFPSPLVGAARP